MHIIPVIDLKNQHVVLAQAGKRSNYQPLNTPLCPSADVFEVIQHFLALYPFKQFYIADLDAILNQGSHAELIQNVLQHYPDIIFWVDNGLNVVDMNKYSYPPNYRIVFGTESQTQIKAPLPANSLLSLDFQDEKPLGAQTIFDDSRFWPDSIILMTLNKVGMNSGPDFKKLAYYRQYYPDKNVIAAGGIRGLADLQELFHLGIKNALVSSCLHFGKLTAADIQSLS